MPARPRFRLPGRRVPRLLAAAFALTVALAPVPADAHHYAGHTPSPVPSLTNDPTTDQGRFIALWDARFRSGEAFQAYLDSEEQYDDGYLGRSPEEQAVLVRALVDYWRATDPGFAEHVDWRDSEPEPETPPDIAERPTADQVITLVDAIIFHKEEFKRALLAQEDVKGEEEPAGPVPDAPAAPADPAAEAARDALAQVVADATALSALGRLSDTVERLAPTAAQVRDAVPQDIVDRLPTAGDVTGLDLGDLDQRLAELRRVVPAEDVAVEVPAVAVAAPLGPENLLYGVCWQLPTTGEQCTGMNYVVGLLTQLPGQAAGFDVDGNLLTGQLGVDLEVGLVIDPLTTPGGLGAAVTVKRYGTAAQNAKGVVRYGLPGSDKEVRVGFDGRAVTLQGQQAASVVFEDIAAMSAGDVRIRATVSHNGTPAVPTVALVTDFLGTATPDTLAATTSFVRAPASATTRLALRRAAGSGIVRVENGHGSAVLPDVRVEAAARLGAARVTGSVLLESVPQSTTVTTTTDDASNTTLVAYDASSQLGRLAANVRMTPNAGAPGNYYAGALDVRRLPTTMSLTVQHANVTYNANTAIGSGTGLALEATLEERLANQLKRAAYLGLSSVPTTVAVTRTAATQRYVLDSPAPIQTATASYAEPAARLAATLTVTGFPGHAELTLPTSNDPRIAWSSSAPTTSVSASGTYGVWNAGVTVTNVPTSMSIVPGTTQIDVNAAAGAPATVEAYLNNTGGSVYSPYAGDNYATLVRTRLASPQNVPGGTITTALSAALKVQGIRRVRVTPGASTTFDLQAGGGAPLYLLVRLDDLVAGTRGYAEARLVSFPGTFTGTIGATTTLAASANADLTAYVESGPIAARPALPQPHGVVFRRTSEPGGLVHRGRVWLTGLPTSVTVAQGYASFGGLRPTQPSLTVDIALLDNAAAPTTARATLSGIPVNVPHTITAEWSTAPVTGGYKTRAKATTSGATFGALSVYVEHARYAAYVNTSALPSSMEAVVTEVEGSTRFDWTASAGIATLDAGFLARATPTASWSGRGSANLTDLPKSFTLVTGRSAGGTGPVLSYSTTDTSRYLDATVVADGSLKTSSLSVNANLYFRLVDLAPVVNVTQAGSGFGISGSGRTAHIEARVSALLNWQKSGSGTAYPQGWVQFPWEYNVSAAAQVRNLAVTLTNVGSLSVEPGITSKVSGDYGSFNLRWDAVNIQVSASGKLRAKVDLWVCQCQFTIVNVSFAAALSVNPTVRVYADAWHDVFSTRVNFFCSYLDFGARVRPTAQYNAQLLNPGVTVYGSPGSHRTNWVTPLLFGSNLLTDVVTGAVAYGGGFVNGWFYAKWTCW